MGETGRVVIEGIPHHIIQRGSCRQRTFFSHSDFRSYVRIMRERCDRQAVKIWAYCLMPNHVHLVAVPQKSEGLGRALGEAHRQYARQINKREKWTGHLWQQRFSSYPMDEEHLVMAARYIELNPVAAGLAPSAEDWPWSSARAHLSGRDDNLVMVEPLLRLVADWEGFLRQEQRDTGIYQKHEGSGLPLGDTAFVHHCEQLTGRILRPQKPGPKGPRRGRA